MDISQNSTAHSGVTQIFLTLLRKNKNEVSITTGSGDKHVGFIEAFDPAGIILYETTPAAQPTGQIYLSRAQIVAIIPTKTVSYIKPYAENDPGKGR